MQKVLLLGATGDTGRRLATLLLDHGFEVVGTTRSPQLPLTRTEEPTSSLPQGRFRWVQCDALAAPDSLQHLLREHGPFGVVINLISAFLRRPTEVLQEGTVRLAQQLSGHVHQAMVFCSGVTVYGHRPGELLTEDSPVRPDTVVGTALCRAEESLQRMAAQQLFPLRILRLPHVYGPSRERTFELARHGQFPVLGDGKNLMCHLHAADLAQALLHLCLSVPPQQIYQLCDDHCAPYGDYFDFIASQTGLPLPTRISEAEALRSGILAQKLGPHLQSSAVVSELYRFMTAEQALSNQRSKQDGLLKQLRYPSFRVGLAEMLKSPSPTLPLSPPTTTSTQPVNL